MHQYWSCVLFSRIPGFATVKYDANGTGANDGTMVVNVYVCVRLSVAHGVLRIFLHIKCRVCYPQYSSIHIYP